MWTATPLTQVSLSLAAGEEGFGAGCLRYEAAPGSHACPRHGFCGARAGAADDLFQLLAASPPAQVEPDGRLFAPGVMSGQIPYSNDWRRHASVGDGRRSGDARLLVWMSPADGDVSNLLLTMTDATTELSGTLTDTAGKPSPDFTIVAASADSRYWVPGSRRIAMTRPGPDGRYTFRSLPPGQYFIAAADRSGAGHSVRSRVPEGARGAAITLTINEGGKTTQDLRVK